MSLLNVVLKHKISFDQAFIFFLIKDNETNLGKHFSQKSSKMLFFHNNRQLRSTGHHSENISKIIFTVLGKNGKKISEFSQDLLHLLVNIYWSFMYYWSLICLWINMLFPVATSIYNFNEIESTFLAPLSNYVTSR